MTTHGNSVQYGMHLKRQTVHMIKPGWDPTGRFKLCFLFQMEQRPRVHHANRVRIGRMDQVV